MLLTISKKYIFILRFIFCAILFNIEQHYIVKVRDSFMLFLCLYEFQRTFSPSCADYILKYYNPYRIFIYADMEYKQQRIMNNYKGPKNTAYEKIFKSDKDRARFYNQTTGQTWGAKENYDLCINSNIRVEETVNLIYNYISNTK